MLLYKTPACSLTDFLAVDGEELEELLEDEHFLHALVEKTLGSSDIGNRLFARERKVLVRRGSGLGIA